MKRAMCILYGASALLLAAASATAEPFADTQTDGMLMEDSSADASAIYSVDEDRDGRTDRELILEHSDSLA